MTFLKQYWLRLLSVPVLLGVVAVSLHACTPEKVAPLPTGPQTVTGSVHGVGLSLSRRGSHVIRVDGADQYYVESASIDVRDYEYMLVVATGTLERNTDPEALPVLVLSDLTLPEMTLEAEDIELYPLSLEVPPTWNKTEFEDGVVFTRGGSGSTTLRIVTSPLSTAPRGKSVTVGGRSSTLVVGTGSVAAYVRTGRDLLVFSADVDTSVEAEDANALQTFLRVLRTVRFRAQASSSPTQSGGSGATLGAPCGGVAGVLCPAGSYCQITDPTDGIGRCRSL